jgi:2-dehydropantoate 2-reductase
MIAGIQFVVIGAGNMGCVYGANLARVGEQVAFHDIWQEHIDAIRERGLRVEGLTGKFTVNPFATINASELPKADCVLVCVNSYSTNSAAEVARCILKPDGFCLTLQNGIGNVETLEERVGRSRVLAGLSFQSGDLAGPAFVRHTNNGPTYLGELDGAQTDRLAALLDSFSRAGLNPEPVPDIIATIWAKFVHNCGINAICAITGLRPGHIQEISDLQTFQVRIIEETLDLVRAKGISLSDADPIGVILDYCAHKFHRPSMMQHLDRGQRTEIDSLNGYVAKESPRYGLSAPMNEALTMLMKGREYRREVP